MHRQLINLCCLLEDLLIELRCRLRTDEANFHLHLNWIKDVYGLPLNKDHQSLPRNYNHFYQAYPVKTCGNWRWSNGELKRIKAIQPKKLTLKSFTDIVGTKVFYSPPTFFPLMPRRFNCMEDQDIDIPLPRKDKKDVVDTGQLYDSFFFCTEETTEENNE